MTLLVAFLDILAFVLHLLFEWIVVLSTVVRVVRVIHRPTERANADTAHRLSRLLLLTFCGFFAMRLAMLGQPFAAAAMAARSGIDTWELLTTRGRLGPRRERPMPLVLEVASLLVVGISIDAIPVPSVLLGPRPSEDDIVAQRGQGTWRYVGAKVSEEHMIPPEALGFGSDAMLPGGFEGYVFELDDGVGKPSTRVYYPCLFNYCAYSIAPGNSFVPPFPETTLPGFSRDDSAWVASARGARPCSL